MQTQSKDKWTLTNLYPREDRVQQVHGALRWVEPDSTVNSSLVPRVILLPQSLQRLH